MFNLNIKQKLFILVLIILIPLIIMQITRINNEFDEKVDTELKSNQDLAEAISISFNNFINEVWAQEAVIGSHITLHPNITVEEIQTYLTEVQLKQDMIKRTSWISSEGIVLASSDAKFIDKSLPYREYIQKILNGQEKVISNLELSVVGNEEIIPVARSIKKDGKLLGILASIIDVNSLYKRLPNSRIPSINIFGLIDKNGMIVYKSDEEDITYEKRKIPDGIPAWKALKGEIATTIEKDSDSYTGMRVDYPIKELEWDCFVNTSYELAMAQHVKRLRNDLIILVLLSLLSIILAYWIGKKILEPLSDIKEVVSAIKAGDFSARTNIKGCDELTATAEAIDSMAESIERNDKMKSQFFTNISHELKTPLNVIFASVQLIEHIELLSPNCHNHSKINKQIKVIKQNSYRLVRMINNLIDVSKCDNGYLTINLMNYNIVSIVEDITMSVVKFSEMKKIELLFDTDIEEKLIACDPDMIERIMLNLLSNSLKFTDKNGSIFVNILDKQDKVVISVKDTGIGIPKDKINVIFEQFEQVDSSLCRNYEGSGIGLSLVKSMVEAHKGTIKASSELGKGAQFIIELPANVLPEASISTTKPVYKSNATNLVEKISIEFSDIYELKV